MASDEFKESTMIEVLELSNNCIRYLNHSLLPLTQLSEINLSFNNITEFSLAEIKGLKELKLVDLSHNKISKLSGHSEVCLLWNVLRSIWLFEQNNHVFQIISEPVSGVEHLKLDYNELESLGGSLIGITTLNKLNISHNKLTDLSPYDLTGLNLKTLDVSHNLLHILPDSSQVIQLYLQISSLNSIICLQY